jgi:hypothetical protein
MHLFRTYVSRFFLGSALLLSVSAANAALIKSYDFNGDLTDTLLNGEDLVKLEDDSGGTGSVANGRYTFLADQGLKLTSAFTDNADYGIEIGFISSQTTEDHKIIDFQELQSGFGLYIDDGAVNFYDISGGLGIISPDSDPFTIGLSRSGGAISLFLDNMPLQRSPPRLPYNPADPLGKAVPGNNILHFFVPDTTTFPDLTIAGSVDFIRIHDDSSTFGTQPISAVPAPATLWLFSTALIGLIGFGKRKVRIAV